MRQAQTPTGLRAWLRHTRAWGAWFDEQHILLASLTLQSTGSVRVTLLERRPTSAVQEEASPAQAHGLVQRLRAAQLPRHERRLALALQGSRCRQGVYPLATPLSPRQLAAEVQLEAASVWGLAPQDLGFDFDVQTDALTALPSVHWVACRRQDVQLWQTQARRAGWRLPMIEHEDQAARRAAQCLLGDARGHGAQSPQDWQFERRPLRHLDEADGLALRASPQWAALVACGAALGLMT